MDSKRLKAIAFTPQAILAIFAEGAVIEMPNGERFQCALNAPTDAKFHHAFYEPRQGWFAIVMEHESFAPLGENMEMRFESVELKPLEVLR